MNSRTKSKVVAKSKTGSKLLDSLSAVEISKLKSDILKSRNKKAISLKSFVSGIRKS